MGQRELITVHHALVLLPVLVTCPCLAPWHRAIKKGKPRREGRTPTWPKPPKNDDTAANGLDTVLVVPKLEHLEKEINTSANQMDMRGKAKPTQNTSPEVTYRNVIGVHCVAILVAAGDQRVLYFLTTIIVQSERISLEFTG